MAFRSSTCVTDIRRGSAFGLAPQDDEFILRPVILRWPRKRPSNECGPKLAYAALQRDRDQLLRLDREFHRQLLQHVLDEAVDHERDRLLGREPALAAIEQ